jgi:preprotein translocase subunit SecY
MIKAFFDKVRLVFLDEDLVRRLFFVVLILFLFRLGTHVPMPGVDLDRLRFLLEGSTGQLLGILNIFSGGGLSNLSIFMLGVSPYITASIVMQLGTIMIPRLKALYHEEGQAGRQKFNQYSRILTIPLAAIQGFGLLALLERQGVLQALSLAERGTSLVIIIAGSLLLMWMGELLSEYGIGNGVSLIIFAGIVARFPTTVGQLSAAFTTSLAPLYILFIFLGLLVLYGVVAITEAERPIPVTYAKQVRGSRVFGGASTYLPIRLNQSGVIPIIFALSILLFPQVIANFLAASNHSTLIKIASVITQATSNIFIYGGFYFFLVLIFTYFYTAVTFDPEAISTNLQKSGAFIPGVRPGQSTALYLSGVVSRVTIVGALFLGIIAVLPFIMQAVTGNPSLAIGGTSLLIVVSVVIDLLKKLNAQVSMREY